MGKKSNGNLGIAIGVLIIVAALFFLPKSGLFSIADYNPGTSGYMTIDLISENQISYTYDVTYHFEEELYSGDCGMLNNVDISYSFSNVHQGVYYAPLPSDIQTGKYFAAEDMDFGTLKGTTNKCSGSEGRIYFEAKEPYAECSFTRLNCQPSDANQGNGCIRVDCNYKFFVNSSQASSLIIGTTGTARIVVPKEGVECINEDTKCVGLDFYTCSNNLWNNQGVVVGECGIECLTGNEKCSGYDFYTCSNNLWNNQGVVVGECGMECLTGNEKCEGEIYYTCSSGDWDSQGLVDGKCGYTSPNIECSAGDTKCEGQFHFICVNDVWFNEGLLDGECGYISPVDECSAGDTKCEGKVFYTCSEENWDSEGLVDGKCGYVVPGGNGDDTEFDLDKVLFKLGDFEVTLLMLIIFLAILLLILVMK